MKKLIWLPFFVFMLLVGVAPQHAAAQNPQTPSPPDESLVQTLLQNTYATTMIFNGSNQNWDCSLTVLQKSKTTDNDPKNTQVSIILEPKFTWESNVTRMYEYLIHTGNGDYQGFQWLKSGEYINLKTDGPLPKSAEKITVQITRGEKTDVVEMKNLIPLNIITPEKALRVMLEVFRATYGNYPTNKYTFYIEFRAPQYWLVSFDDNDGIGGRGYLLVNAYSGVGGDIREDE